MSVKAVIMKIPGNAYFRHKDAYKFACISKFIGQGSPASSTAKYAKALETIANTGKYTSEDIVGISSEGARRERVKLNKEEIMLAVKANVMGFVTDTLANRDRSYNIGEREVARLLRSLGYADKYGEGYWIKSNIMRIL